MYIGLCIITSSKICLVESVFRDFDAISSISSTTCNGIYMSNILYREGDPHVLADLRSLRRTKIADQSRRRSKRVALVVLSPAERGKYQEILFQARKTLTTSTPDTRSSSLLGYLIRLRQICSHGIHNTISKVTESVPKCCQCDDDLPSPQTAPRTVRMGQQNGLCYDCGLASGDSTSILASGISYDTQTGARIDSSAMEIDSGTDTS